MGRGADAIKALAQNAFAAHSSALDRAVAASGPESGLRTLLDVTGDGLTAGNFLTEASTRER